MRGLDDVLHADFQTDAVSGERRTSGTAASLAGIEIAQQANDPGRLQRAIDRYIAAYSMVFGFGGIPLIYMGDEIGLLNDYSFVDEPEHAADNRWLHRPMMDWPRAKAARTSSEYSGRLLRGLTELIRVADARTHNVHARVEYAQSRSCIPHELSAALNLGLIETRPRH